MAEKTYAMALRETIASEMRREPDMIIIGEDVGSQGGIYGVTKGFSAEFGADRVINAPISESAHIGIGLGAACCGIPMMIELQYWDFALVAADQLINQVAKTRFVFGIESKIPLVIRSQEGTGRGNGATHSQSVETMLMHFPGLKVVCPSSANDAAGLLRTAMRDPDPVCFFEHKLLYHNNKEDVNEDPDFMIPFGQARILREGTDCTVVATMLYVHRALEAADILAQEGISVEVVDPRTLVPFDYDTVVESVKKTGRLVIAHEAHKTAGWGAEVAAQVTERAFDYLAAPPLRLGALACPIPFNPFLEKTVLPSVQQIVEAVREQMKR